jgi:hypothetical protein
MRGLIGILVAIMFLLVCNIFVYTLSEDYRFFLKKLKYKEEIVYNEHIEVDDTQRVLIQEDDAGNTNIIIPDEDITFLDALSGKTKAIEEDEALQELTQDEQFFLESFEKKYVLEEKWVHASLFNLTTEYPDDYYEFYNKHLNLYIFPTKSYEEVKSIFQVLTYELPYTLNQTNNFGTSSFYINLDEGYEDDNIRIVLEYKKRAFWLKISKDNYNRAKEILESL